MAKKKAASAASVAPTFTEVEQDLLSHIQGGCELVTDSLAAIPFCGIISRNYCEE
jgi:hypothetical protein